MKASSAERKDDRKIVFIPTYHYLSSPLFSSIVMCTKASFKSIYLDPRDPLFSRQNPSIKGTEFAKTFDEFREVRHNLAILDIQGAKSIAEKARRLGSFVYWLFRLKTQLYMELNDIGPDVIVTTSDLEGYTNRVCNTWAEKKKVPFIVMQPSFVDLAPSGRSPKGGIELFVRAASSIFSGLFDIPIFRRQEVFGNERLVNHVFLYGEHFKRYYRGLKAEENVHVTGNPVFDPIIGLRERGGLERKAPDGFNSTVTICTEFLEGILPPQKVSEINWFYKFAIRDNPNIYFVIKLHPREDEEKYKKIFSDLDATNYTVLKDVNIYDLFKVSDVQVSMASYSSFEAIVYGIPIILVNTSSLQGSVDYFDNEIELRANTAEELSGCLREAISQEYKERFKLKRETYLRSRLGCIDGRSCERVDVKIKEVIKSN